MLPWRSGGCGAAIMAASPCDTDTMRPGTGMRSVAVRNPIVKWASHWLPVFICQINSFLSSSGMRGGILAPKEKSLKKQLAL
jgi:hypothetical protein